MPDVYCRNDAIVARRIGAEVVLVPIGRNGTDLEHIFTLNETAAFIWDLLDGRRTVRDISKRIEEEFDVDPTTAEGDLLVCLAELESVKAVTTTRAGEKKSGGLAE